MKKKKAKKKKDTPLTTMINYGGNEKKTCKDCGHTYTCDYVMHQAFCSAHADGICDECGLETNPDELDANGGICDECFSGEGDR